MKTALCLFLSAVTLLFVNVSPAELQKETVPESSFATTEYKILLSIPEISARDSIAATYEKIDRALEMIDVRIASGGEERAYLDSKDQRLRKGGYILRWKKGSTKATLKARWTDVKEAHLLKGEDVKFSKYEIDFVDGKPIYSISYGVKIGALSGEVTGVRVWHAIKATSPDLGAFLDGLLQGAELTIPGWATAHGTSGTLKAGTLPCLGDATLNLEIDVFYFGTEHAVAELSFRGGGAANTGDRTYRELTDLLREKGLLNKKQSTKTSYYLDYYAK